MELSQRSLPMSTARTCLALGAAAALTITGGVAAAQAEAHAPSRFSFESQLTAIQFFGTTGPIIGFPTKPLVPGDRIIGQDRIMQAGRTVGTTTRSVASRSTVT